MNAREYRAILSALDHALATFDRQIACSEAENRVRENLAQVRNMVAERARKIESGLDGGPDGTGG